MKILHAIYTHGISGAEKYLDYLLPGLNDYGIECHLIFICPPKYKHVLLPFAESFNNKGIKAMVISGNRIHFFSIIQKIKKYLIKNDIKVVHSHLINTDILFCVLKQFFYKPIFLISTKHGYYEKILNKYDPDNYTITYNAYRFFTKYTLKKIDCNISVSKGISDMFCNLKLTKEHFPVLHHGIDIVQPYNASTYQKSGQTLVIVGRLAPIKGHKYLLNAMVDVLEKFPDCKLLVLGEGAIKKELEDYCKKLGISNNVLFLGFRTDPYSYISHADIIILPSLFEPFGLVYIEAMALKTPVIAFDTPAGNEILQNNTTALLVPKANSQMLGEKIITLLQDSSLRSQIANEAYANYSEKFTSAIMIKNTAIFYKALGL